MLRVIGEAPSADVNIEFGEYVPFKFQFADTGSIPHCYWRAGDMDSSLIEVGINIDTGAITGVTVLLCGNIRREFPNLSGADRSCDGVPIIAIDGWPENRYLDETLPFTVFADASRVLILFSESSIAVRSIISGEITFGVSHNEELVWIMVEGNVPSGVLR